MKIKAFKALRYNVNVVRDVGNCIAPPYDVIDADQQERLYKKSQYNIVRIIKGKLSETDSDSDSRYTRAARFFNSWMKKGVLKTDPAPAIYAYVQDFSVGNNRFQRSGFVALGKLEEFGGLVQPHEKTLAGPKADRLNLMSATNAQFGQVFMLYDDSEKIADRIIARTTDEQPLLNFTDDQGVRHRLFGIVDTKDIEAIVKMMADKKAIIADGHHRYETALNYYKETHSPAAAYRMMTFVNMRNEGLIILPIHRLINGLSSFNIRELLKKLDKNFDISLYAFSNTEEKNSAMLDMFERMRSESGRGCNAFGIYTTGGTFYAVVLKNQQAMLQAAPAMSEVLRRLDVSVLHTLILDKQLGIGEKQLEKQNHIEYIKDIGRAIDEAIERIDRGDAQAIFFVNATKVEHVKAVAAAGLKMPQKSTFFYPKIFTGLTINKIKN